MRVVARKPCSKGLYMTHDRTVCVYRVFRPPPPNMQVGQIDNEYRVFNMEVLAGEPSFETEVLQHGIRFRLDFSKVCG